MLGVETLNAQEYLGYVSMGPCEVSTKSESGSPNQCTAIDMEAWRGRTMGSCPRAMNSREGQDGSFAQCRVRRLTLVKNDTFRTLATDKEFKGRVDEDMLIRLLEAFIWKSKGRSTG